MKVTDPFAPWVTAVTASGPPSMSLSLLSTERVTGVSSATEPASFAALGASLTGVMVIETVAVAEPPLPSPIV